MRVGVVTVALAGIVALAGCGGADDEEAAPRASAPPRVTVAQFDKDPCAITTNAALADALADEYATWRLRPADRPTPGEGSCAYLLTGSAGGGDLELTHSGHSGTQLDACRRDHASRPARSRLVAIGDGGCVDDMSFVYFRSGDDYFAVTTTLLGESGAADKRYQPLTVAAARYFLGRLRLPS